MPAAINAMESERQCHQRLRKQFQRNRPCRERSCHHRAFQVQADVWRDQVEAAKDVEAAAENAARDAVECREVPCHLCFVDSEMGRYGAVEPLLGEDALVFGLRGDCLGGGQSGGIGEPGTSHSQSTEERLTFVEP